MWNSVVTLKSLTPVTLFYFEVSLLLFDQEFDGEFISVWVFSGETGSYVLAWRRSWRCGEAVNPYQKRANATPGYSKAVLFTCGFTLAGLLTLATSKPPCRWFCSELKGVFSASGALFAVTRANVKLTLDGQYHPKPILGRVVSIFSSNSWQKKVNKCISPNLELFL